MNDGYKWEVAHLNFSMVQLCNCTNVQLCNSCFSPTSHNFTHRNYKHNH